MPARLEIEQQPILAGRSGLVVDPTWQSLRLAGRHVQVMSERDAKSA
jgi:hypothetical protein